MVLIKLVSQIDNFVFFSNCVIIFSGYLVSVGGLVVTVCDSYSNLQVASSNLTAGHL